MVNVNSWSLSPWIVVCQTRGRVVGVRTLCVMVDLGDLELALLGEMLDEVVGGSSSRSDSSQIWETT